MDTAMSGHTIRRYTRVQRDAFVGPVCTECKRRMVPRWIEDRGRWIINGFQYPGVRCSNHERRVLPEYFGLPQQDPTAGLTARSESAGSARRPKAGSRFLGLGTKRAARGVA